MTAETTVDLPARDEVDSAQTWNREALFEDKDAWEKAMQEAPELLGELPKYQGRLHEGPDVLAEAMVKYEQAARRVMNLYWYAVMESSVDSSNPENTAMVGRGGALFGQFQAAAAFIRPELLKVGRETLDRWLAEKPELQQYDMYIDDLFRQGEHIRDDTVEQVLGMVSEPFQAATNTYDVLTSSDLTFKPAVDSQGDEKPVAQASLATRLASRDREERRTAYENYQDEYIGLKNTMASLYLTSVKQDVFNVRVRGYNSSLEASLFEDNIPVEVFHNLIETFKQNIPTWHKYWAIRRKMLGVETLQPYDIWAPLVKQAPHVPFEQAVDWISKGIEPLGQDYVDAMRKGTLQDRWVDRAVNKGKRQGAFSGGTYDTHPSIMMSYDDSLSAMSTLTHELGHSMHTYMSQQNQPFARANYTLFAAEVASNFHQAMTRAYLKEAKADDPNFQIALIEEAIENFHRYFLIMPTLARFEHEIHQRVEQGQSPTADEMINLCADLFGEAYGEEMGFDRQRTGITWATFPHLYRAYYTYSYATGISAAHELARQVQQGGPQAAQHYREFLSAGGSMYPLDALKHAGVDMTQPDAVETTFGELEDMVNRLEKLTDA